MPGSHSVQLALPSSGATVPDTHQWHRDSPDVGAYVPFSHDLHASLALSLNLPGTHATHASSPGCRATAPGAQGTHALRSVSANVPRAHVVQLPSAASQAVPFPHPTQFTAPGRENARYAHGMHVWLSAIRVLAGHGSQASLASSGTRPSLQV